MNTPRETRDVRETRCAQHVRGGEASASVMAVHDHAPLQVVIEFSFEFIESSFELLKWKEPCVLKSADIPLRLCADVENERPLTNGTLDQLREFPRSGFVLGAMRISRRKTILVE